MADALKRPLLDNPYVSKDQKKKKTTVVSHRKSMKTPTSNTSDEMAGDKKDKKRREEELAAAKEMIKRSDIKVSNALKIDDFKRSTAEIPVKVKEGAFASHMRQAS